MQSLVIGYPIHGKGWIKNNSTCENAVSQSLYGSCMLRVMGSCLKLIQQNVLSEQPHVNMSRKRKCGACLHEEI